MPSVIIFIASYDMNFAFPSNIKGKRWQWSNGNLIRWHGVFLQHLWVSPLHSYLDLLLLRFDRAFQLLNQFIEALQFGIQRFWFRKRKNNRWRRKRCDWMSLLKWFCLCFFVCMFGVESVNVSNGSRKKTIESEVRYAIAHQGRFEADGFAIPAKQLFSVTTMRSLSSFTSRTRWRVDWSFLSIYSSCWWKEDRSGVEGGSDDVCSESVCWSCSAWNRVSIYYRFRDAFAHIDAGARWFHWTCILQKDREIECTVLALHVVHSWSRDRERLSPFPFPGDYTVGTVRHTFVLLTERSPPLFPLLLILLLFLFLLKNLLLEFLVFLSQRFHDRNEFLEMTRKPPPIEPNLFVLRSAMTDWFPISIVPIDWWRHQLEGVKIELSGFTYILL